MKPDLLVYGNAIADHQNRKKQCFEALKGLQGCISTPSLKGFCHVACSSVRVVGECRVSLRRL